MGQSLASTFHDLNAKKVITVVIAIYLTIHVRRISREMARQLVRVAPPGNETTHRQPQHAHTNTFPDTLFTTHVNHLLSLIATRKEIEQCDEFLRIFVHSPLSRPSKVEVVSNEQKRNQVNQYWLTVINRTFSGHRPERVLPGNVSLCVSAGDYHVYEKHGNKALASSGRGGKFCITNFLEIKRQAQQTTYPVLPWESRHRLPVWRGTGWGLSPGPFQQPTNASHGKILDWALNTSRGNGHTRFDLVLFSNQNPHLLDAKLSNPGFTHELWQHNSTNGLNQLLPLDSIDQNDYYTKYQVAVVMGGIGAAFRTSIHFSTMTAVVLQEFHYKEWFTSLLTPFANYIPLAQDLSDLNETLLWIQNNPDKVLTIAQNGHKFYEDYLSFDRNEEHIFELLYKLAQKQVWESAWD